MLNVFIVVVGLSLAGYLAFSKRLSSSTTWKATMTPLASIMGSGFLVCAPLLAGVVGNLALVCMALLLVLAYAVGGAIRFNIKHFEPIEEQAGMVQNIAFLARIVLAGAYFISVTYYIKLLAAFALNAFNIHAELTADVVSTLLLLTITGVGMWRGLSELEKVESYSISLNLGMIGALVLGLCVYNVGLVTSGHWTLPDISSDISFHDMRVLLGLLIVVQGFETSRYLGEEHSASQRITTMRLAQIISTLIYLLFISLVTVLFHQGIGANVTAIISMAAPVAAVLPLLISIAAIGSQFSAAVADTSGAGGLLEDITHRRFPIRYAYVLILMVTLVLTWVTNVNAIIGYASRAFALFYALQCLVAFLVACRVEQLSRRPFWLLSFALLTIVCLLIFALGVPSA
ncbi:hypothetical protein [Celerinatantimonas yamalensis]|uniref:Amino acid permease n=1 Tax=Celerinatantimonas yamalensis TaxID=559956 RepID=A0ABW9G5W9_9GAMM